MTGSFLIAAGLSTVAVAATVPPTPIPADIIVGNATYTGRDFIDTSRVGELTHKQILDMLLGGNFQSAGAHDLDFSNGGTYVRRIADDMNPVTQNKIAQVSFFGDETDQTWSGDFSGIEARYRFATYEQSFGYSPSDTTNYTKLLDVTYQHYGSNYTPINVPGGSVDTGEGSIHWVRGRDNGLFSSNPTLNRDDRDHMITYEVFSQVSERQLISEDQPQYLIEHTYLLFWEDQTETANVHWYDVGDWDYNDLVVELRTQLTPVPEPTSLAMMGIGSLALLRRRRVA